jgi:hypothetical protein
MTTSGNFDQAHRFAHQAAQPRVAYGRALEKDNGAELLLGLVIVIVIIVLLLIQGDPGVGLAP